MECECIDTEEEPTGVSRGNHAKNWDVLRNARVKADMYIYMKKYAQKRYGDYIIQYVTMLKKRRQNVYAINKKFKHLDLGPEE